MAQEMEPLELGQIARPAWDALPGDRPINLCAADVVDRVRDLLPDADAATLADACETFAAMLNAEDLTYWRANTARARAAHRALTMDTPDAEAFEGKRGGGVVLADIGAAWSGDPDAWRGAHTVKRGRNRRGGQTALVVKRGDAVVIGRLDRDVSGRPILAIPERENVDNWAWCAARMLVRGAESGDLHRHVDGWSALDVTAITEHVSALDDQMPRLLGTDAMSWEQTITPAPGVDLMACRVAAHRAGVAIWQSDTLVGTLGAPGDVCAAHTQGAPAGMRITGDDIPDSAMVWASHAVREQRAIPTRSARARIPRKPRKRDAELLTAPRLAWHATPRVGAYAHPMAPRGALYRVTDLLAPTDDANTIWRGHHAVARPAPIKRGQRKPRTVRATRTLALTAAPTTRAQWLALATHLGRGKRLVACGGAVIVTHTERGRYTCTDKRGDTARRWTVRTADAVAIRLATA